MRRRRNCPQKNNSIGLTRIIGRRRRDKKNILGWASGGFDSLELPLIGKKKKIVVDCAPRNSSPGPNILLRDYIRAGARTTFFPSKHANDVGRVQELRKTRIFGTCRILDWMRKFNFLDDEKVNREKKEKSKLVIAHLYFINIFFAHLYSTVSSGLLNYQDSRCTTSSTSSSAMERSFEKLSMLPSKTSVSAGHSALQNAGTENGIRRKR